MKNIYFVLTCFLAIVILSSWIDSYERDLVFAEPDADVPVFLRFLGEARSMVSSLSILQADIYHHGGVGAFPEEHAGMSSLAEKDHQGHIHEDGHAPTASASRNVLLRISDALAITAHIHLEGDQLKEIIPWLYYAFKIDPHNEQAYVLTSYYLSDRLGKHDEAVSLLRAGLSKNPDSWKISSELGRVYFKYYEDYGTAAGYFLKAWKLMRSASHDKFQERSVLIFLTSSYEALGRNAGLLPLYERLNELFPGKRYRDKIREIQVQSTVHSR